MNDLTKILPKIRNVDLSDYPDISLCKTPMQKGLWALWILDEKFELHDQYFTTEELAEVLVKKGISIYATEITRGFTRAAKNIHKTTNADGKAAFIITTKGKDSLRQLKGINDIKLISVNGNKPWTGYKQFSEIVKQTTGETKIVDKFYSRDSLDTIVEFTSGDRKVQFLTAKLASCENERKFANELKRFKRENTNIEIRKYPKEYELHDRYVITDNYLILLGRGLQDIGGKESFVIALKNTFAKDIISDLNSKFEDRWKKSQNLN